MSTSPDPNGFDAILAAVRDGRRGRHLLVLSDFDGTLCEFDPDPAAVYLSPARRRILGVLAARRDTSVGLVTGRRLADVRARAAVEGPLFVAGLHGLEIEGPAHGFVHPAVSEVRGLLQVLGRALATHVAGLPGVFVENKDLSITLHVRDAARPEQERAEALLARVAGPQLEDGHLRLVRGSEVFELLPAIPWNKGSAVQWIRAAVERPFGPAWTVYLGDDVPDEDAFRVVTEGVTIIVGTRPSAARFRLRDPAEVEALLAQLAAMP